MWRRPVPLPHLRHGAAHRAIPDPGPAAASALRPDRRAARAARHASRPGGRHDPTSHGPGDLHQGHVDDGVPGRRLPRRVRQRLHRLRPPRRGRFHAAGAGRADLRVAPPARGVPEHRRPHRAGPDGPRVRRAGGLGRRLEFEVPVARRSPPRGLPKLAAVTRIVAVSATRRTDAGRERVALNTAYVYALMRAGLVPLLVPPILDPEAACAALDGVHGLVLTGGEDVEPGRYGATPHSKLGETDRARDAVELALIAGAERRRLPVLAICRGIQILNVALGGTLYQDLASERPGPVDHADTRSRHGLRIESGTLLHRTLEAVDASVNTRHHQAIRDVAPGLRATAWAEDGVIEGAERKDPGAPWTLAVQWHPEDDVEGALFRGFAEAIA
ncbi:MAG: hypothetical protein DMD70_05740 [Gemmatimonadetes bacterium]|nr:MAG: hypothetical protein DMD70_05740 [Gemmatimonadota bacterium]